VPRLLPRSTREIEQLLASFGFRFGHHGKEDIWVRDADRRVVVVPRNRSSGQIPVGTVKGILVQAGIARADAMAFWGAS
jgi:predicted RNA binding protein YcfA (HicA-like mRNA interferase family)